MDLLILAAGMGSRFGGLKQIEPFDDKQNFIIDYSIFDAKRAGFDRVVFLIKEENRQIFEETVGSRVAKYIDVAYAYQKLDVVPEGYEMPKDRVKPLGTAQAIYCAKVARRDDLQTKYLDWRERYRQDPENANLKVMISLSDSLQSIEREILSYASKLGLTPESRARLAKRIAEQDEDDPDGDLFA